MNVIAHEGSRLLHQKANRITLRVPGMLGNQINHAVHRIGSPDGRSGTPDHFDPVDHGNGIIVDRIVCAAKHQLRNFSPSDLAEELLSGETAEVSHGCKIVISQTPADVHTRNPSQGFHRIGVTELRDVLRLNDVNRSGIPPIQLIVPKNALNLHVCEIPEFHFQQTNELCLLEGI